MINISTKSRLLSVLIMMCFSVSGIAQEMHGDSRFFPDLMGWTKPQKIDVYHPGTLWDIINGAADVYLNYDFEELTAGNYTSDNENYIGLEIYRHASVYDAFGIYSQERPINGDYLEIGAQGYRDKGVLNFFSDNYYVKIRSHQTDETTMSEIENLASLVAESISPDASLPVELGFFPTNGLIPNSEQYINKSFLGLSFLSNAFIASYEMNNLNYNLFVINNGSGKIAEQVLNNYLKFAKMEQASGPGRYIINDRYNGPVGMLWKDNYLFGFYNLTENELQNTYFIWFEKVIITTE